MERINTIDLTPFKNDLSDEELQDYDMGEIVSTPDGAGIIAGMSEESFEFPVGAPDRMERIEEEEEITDDMMEEIDASEDEPVYIVALQKGGSVAVTADEISAGALEGDEGTEITSWDEETTDTADEAELAPVYKHCDNPGSRASLERAKVKFIHENYASELARYVDEHDSSLAVLQEMSSEELVNIRGVDDPHVGFDRLPPGWTRKSVLQAWASVGGMWRTCYPRMIRVRGPNFAKRWCAALKDEVLRTEEWRGKF